MARLWTIRLVLAALMPALGLGFAVQADSKTRSFFQLTAGSSAGSYFAVGEAIAGIVSHPVGLSRCAGGNCGPAGLIVSVRTSEGASANILAVERGLSDSGLSHSNTLADAVNGKGMFRKTGPVKHVRLIASLYDEPVQLVAAKGSKIAAIGDLIGKRVSLGDAESGGYGVARAILASYRISYRRLRRSALPLEGAVRALRAGKIDAFFYVGAAPTPLIRDLVARGAATLIPLDGQGRARALRRLQPYRFAALSLPAETYPGMKPLPTLSGRALWVVRDSVPAELVQALLAAFYHPVNRGRLAVTSPLRRLTFSQALDGGTVPLHPGATGFYRRMGLIKPPPNIPPPPSKSPAKRH